MGFSSYFGFIVYLCRKQNDMKDYPISTMNSE